MQDRDYILQVIDISYPSGTTAGTLTSNQRFDSSYEKVEGVALIEKGNGGNAQQYEVGFDFPNDNRTVRTVNKAMLQFDPSTPASDRFMKLNASAKGGEFAVNTRLLQAASADLDYQLVFLLSKPQIC